MKIFLISLILLSCLSSANELDEIISLSKTKVSPPIIKTYINNLTNKLDLSATNIIRLKKEGVSDELVLYMLNKQTVVMTNTVEKYIVVEPNTEDYQFFKKYYLIPRAESFRYKLDDK